MNQIEKFLKMRAELDEEYKKVFYEIPNKLHLRVDNKFIELYGLSQRCSIHLTCDELKNLRNQLEILLKEIE